MNKEIFSRIVQTLFGSVLFELGRPDEAGANYKKAIEADPGYLDAYIGMGILYGAMDREDAAIDMFQKALVLDDNCAMAHANLAVAYFFKKEYGPAVRHCERAEALGAAISPDFLAAIEPYRGKVK